MNKARLMDLFFNATAAVAGVTVVATLLGGMFWLISYYNFELAQPKLLELIGQTEHPECVARYVASKEYPESSLYFTRRHILAAETACEHEAKAQSLDELRQTLEELRQTLLPTAGEKDFVGDSD